MVRMTTRDKLIVALDLPNGNAATRMAERLRRHVGMFKVGSELFTAEGPVPVRYLVTTGRSVFLDLKFHDIPNTVRAAAREAAELGVSMVNVHASGGRKMMEAALEGARSAGAVVGDEARPKVLAVTILTSLESRDLEELGISGTPVEAVIRMARLAQSAGLDGVVASPREISAIRQACGPGFLIVTPGIRPASALHHPVRGSAGTVAGDGAGPRVLAVTILTSLASQDLEELGISGTAAEAVVRLARLAQSAGLDGVVASPREISAIRQACGPGFLIVTPGIRPASAVTNDQARIATPASAIAAGADYLVVGRPITGAADPVAAADAIVAEMDGTVH